MRPNLYLYKLLFTGLLGFLFAHSIVNSVMRFSRGASPLFAGLSFVPFTGALRDYETCGANLNVSLDWYPPPKTDHNDLAKVINGEGIYGYIFDSSDGPRNQYNYCNMPRVNEETYPRADPEYLLEYVEIIQRHHKRTPYAHNGFPLEGEKWHCDDELLFYGGEITGENALGSVHSYWTVYTTNANPMIPLGFNGTCQFPQITGDGLVDSWQHGKDLKRIYHDVTDFLPNDHHSKASSYRVTNNVITSQVASRLILGMWGGKRNEKLPLLVQPASVDSLEPSYPCKAADDLYATFGPGGNSDRWRAHLRRSEDLRKRLDGISGVDPEDEDWSSSWDHYFDNLSARLCHQKPLPCSTEDPTDCVSMQEAEEVFRLGEYEYSYLYRDSKDSLKASVASFGVWVGELVQNFRSMMTDEVSATASATSSRTRWRHNTAHDGSIARLLSILQVNQMVWPGMGAEIVFELYSKDSGREEGLQCYYLRVLWGGQILRSSHPAFGRMDMIPIGTFLAYVDGLVGVRGEKIPEMCRGTL